MNLVIGQKKGFTAAAVNPLSDMYFELAGYKDKIATWFVVTKLTRAGEFFQFL